MIYEPQDSNIYVPENNIEIAINCFIKIAWDMNTTVAQMIDAIVKSWYPNLR